MPVKEYTNRLINEKSPYLLQHAHNPVDWFPWSDEAFQKAKAEDKPVFLSIGYSTCHWCHVMERESFEDEEVAALLNKSFVSIKVDREERPDVDNFYMNACMALGGSGGWPLSCFLTPDKRAFFAGTYFPKNDNYGMPGFVSLLGAIALQWHDNREELTGASASILEHIAQTGSVKKAVLRSDADSAAFNALSRSFDEKNGGFSGAPKFPSLQNLLFLMRFGLANGEGSALDMVRKTLDGMKNGGIFDQIGGGFYRYSTDGIWLTPHFEKMLYDNALHIMAYSEAAALIDPGYARTARDTTEFVMRELCDESGGFYTAMDADSEGEEGKFYLFMPKDVEAALGKADGGRFCKLYDITPEGNFENKSIPNLIKTKPTEEDRAFASAANKKLLQYRSGRVPPFRDDKVLTSNNGLMIAALATEGRVLCEPAFTECAEKCAAFILGNLVAGGRLLARWRNGEAGIPATCDDYAYLIWGLIELYESTFKPYWLEQALKLSQRMDSLFWDDQNGGYFLGGSDVSDLPLRQKEFYDGAVPSGNSVAALNLLRLSRLTGNPALENRMKAIFEAAAAGVNQSPSSHCGLLCAVVYAKAPGSEIIIADGEGFEFMKSSLPRFAPFTVSAVCGGAYEGIAKLAPFISEYRAIDGKAAAYVCHGGACMQPVAEPSALKKLLAYERVVF